jgi:hypothetical protein
VYVSIPPPGTGMLSVTAGSTPGQCERRAQPPVGIRLGARRLLNGRARIGEGAAARTHRSFVT